ncbi:MAG: DUF6932 family protein [Pseudomonadota bacterium]
MNVSIPDWTAEGVLPPVDAGDPTSLNRSPYHVSLLDLVEHFGTSKERIRILDGFLRYRTGLHEAGLTQGFQWLDGSYMEHVEAIEKRSPNDIDVVSFIEFPSGMSEMEIKTHYSDIIGLTRNSRTLIKRQLMVDAFMVPLNRASSVDLVALSTYWYGVWSHRRDRAWKGFIQVFLMPDHAARARLDSLMGQEENV